MTTTMLGLRRVVTTIPTANATITKCLSCSAAGMTTSNSSKNHSRSKSTKVVRTGPNYVPQPRKFVTLRTDFGTDDTRAGGEKYGDTERDPRFRNVLPDGEDPKRVPYFARYAGMDLRNEPKPLPLHVVWRVGTMQGRPYWEKNVMRFLKIDGPINTPQIVKNTPRYNELLWSVKHMIKIRPLRLPQGAETLQANMLDGTLLKPDGSIVHSKYARYNTFGREINNVKLEKYVFLTQYMQNRLGGQARAGSLTGILE